MSEPDSALSVPDTASFGVNFMPQLLDKPALDVPDATPTSDRARSILDPEKTAAITSQHAVIERQRGEAMNYADRQMNDRIEGDRAKMERAYQAEGAAKDNIPPPWNADKERQDRIRGPLEQFGSIGMVFAMAASAFTKTPMTSALNAGAAAMKAIQEHDEKGYESAYAAWKDNTNLALKRFEAERQMFQDADKLLSSDMQAWRAKQLSIAARFDNQKAIMFLDNGMDKELLDMQASQVRAAAEMQKTVQGMEEFDLQRTMFKEGVAAFRQQNPNATPLEDVRYRVQLLHDIKNAQKGLSTAGRGSSNPEWQYISQRVPELMKSVEEGGKGLTQTEAMAEATQEYRAARQAPVREGTEADFIQRRKPELMKSKEEGGEGLSDTEAAKQAAKEWTESRRAKPIVTQQRQIAQEIDRRKAALIEGGMGETEAFNKASREVRMAAQVPGGNRITQLQSRVDAIGYSRYTMDKAEELLNKHWGITGLGGMVTRPMESVGNATSISNATDRRQFERFVEELKEWGPTVLLDRSGRPLSTEASRMNAIIAGLRPGDTVANTKRAFAEMRKLWVQIEGQVKKQLEGDWTPADPKGGGAPKGGDWWKRVPDKRSDGSDGDRLPPGASPTEARWTSSFTRQDVDAPTRQRINDAFDVIREAEDDGTIGSGSDVPEGSQAAQIIARDRSEFLSSRRRR